MIRLVRILKILKDSTKIMKYLNDFMMVGLGAERLVFFLLIYLILVHVMSCCWIITGELTSLLDGDNNKSWMDDYYGLSDGGIYLNACYFAISTMTTVGYGDISGANIMEVGVSVICTIIGAATYVIGTGSLSSIMSSYD